MDFDQTCTDTSFGVRILIDYGDIVAIFKVICGLRRFKTSFPAPYLLNGLMDLSQTCIDTFISGWKRTTQIFVILILYAVSQKAKNVKNGYSASYLLNGWI